MPEINNSNSPLNNSQHTAVSKQDIPPASDESGKNRQGQSVQQVNPDSISSRIKTFFGEALKLRSITDRQATVVHTAMDVIPEMIPGKVRKSSLKNVVEDTELGAGKSGRVYRTKPKKAGKIGRHPHQLHKNYVVKDQEIKDAEGESEQERHERIQGEVRIQKGIKGSVPVVDERLKSRHGVLHHKVMMENGGHEAAELIGLTDAKKAEKMEKHPCQLLRGEPLNEGICRVIATELFQQLADFHEQNVVHRDIKPGNILVNQQGKASFVDFGYAQQVHDDTSSGDRDARKYSGSRGTATYAAPEIIVQDKYSEKVDCWSMGIVLLELLTGEHPPVSVHELTRKLPKVAGKSRFGVVHERYLELTQHIKNHPLLSPEAKETILSLIQLNPVDRPSARDVLNQDFFQVPQEAGAKGRHFQLQAQHREKLRALAEKERSLEALKSPKKSWFRKPRVETTKTRVIEKLEREIQFSGLEVKSLQEKMALEDLYAEANRLEKKVSVALNDTSTGDTGEVVDGLNARIAATKRDISLKVLDVKHSDNVLQLTQQKNSLTDRLVKERQNGSSKLVLESLINQIRATEAQLHISDEQHQLDCLLVERAYLTDQLDVLTENDTPGKGRYRP